MTIYFKIRFWKIQGSALNIALGKILCRLCEVSLWAASVKPSDQGALLRASDSSPFQILQKVRVNLGTEVIQESVRILFWKWFISPK